MFKRRDIPPVLLLLLLIELVMFTLSQILVVHNGRYRLNIHSIRGPQLELKEIDVNLHTMMLQNVPSVELNRQLLQNEINSHRVAQILVDASQPDLDLLPVRNHSRTTSDSAPGNATAAVNRSAVADAYWGNSMISLVTDDKPESEPLYCPAIPPGLVGRVFIEFDHKHDYNELDIIRQNPSLLPGGVSRPLQCIARHRVAVIVPYRDRRQHLNTLLSHLHPMLQRQQLDYRIYVVEQYGEYTFNKARIMNAAFVEALKQYSFQCFVFHDVDLIPEDDRNMYSCPPQPRHLSVAVDEMGYKLAYQVLVGGVLNMRTEHFQRVNGYSNLYWGWGAEDDDMAFRILYVGLKITRPPNNVARYRMIRHTKREPSDLKIRLKLLYTGTRRFQFDGLNSLHYRLVHIANTPLYTHILVDIGKPPRGF